MVPRSIALGSGDARSKSCSFTHLVSKLLCCRYCKKQTSLRGPFVRYQMDPSIDYLQYLRLIVYVEAQQFLRAVLSPKNYLLQRAPNQISSSYQIWNFGFWKFSIWMLYRPLFAFPISFIYHFYSHVGLFNSSFVWCSRIHSLIKSFFGRGLTHPDIFPERFESANKNPFLEYVLFHQNNLYSFQPKSELMAKYKTVIWKCLWLGFWQKQIINKLGGHTLWNNWPLIVLVDPKCTRATE